MTLRLEELERRDVPATFTWKYVDSGGGVGHGDDPNNWTQVGADADGIPDFDDDVVIPLGTDDLYFRSVVEINTISIADGWNDTIVISDLWIYNGGTFRDATISVANFLYLEDGTAPYTVTGLVSFTDSSGSPGTGAVIIEELAVAETSGSTSIIIGLNFDVSGSLILNDDPIEPTVYLADYGGIFVDSGGEIVIKSKAVIDKLSGNDGALEMNGYLIKQGTGQFLCKIPVVSSGNNGAGVIDLGGGTSKFTGESDNGYAVDMIYGSIYIFNNANVEFGHSGFYTSWGGITFDGATTTSITGDVRIEDGWIDMDVPSGSVHATINGSLYTENVGFTAFRNYNTGDQSGLTVTGTFYLMGYFRTLNMGIIGTPNADVQIVNALSIVGQFDTVYSGMLSIDYVDTATDDEIWLRV